MKSIVFVILILGAYVAGYLTPKQPVEAGNIAVPSAVVQVQPQSLTPVSAPVNDKQANQSPAISTAQKNKPKNNEPSLEKPAAQQYAEPQSSPSNKDSQSPMLLTDVEIDSLVPEPFNRLLKGLHGNTREEYSRFARQEFPNDVDIEIYNRLSDGISANPYAKFLNIDSLQCKAGLCEIRVYETKPEVWNYVMAEMRLQNWWKFDSVSVFGMGDDGNNRNGNFVLITY